MKPNLTGLGASLALISATAFAQIAGIDLSQIGQMTRSGTSAVKSLTLQAETPRIRPLGSTVIQVRVYGTFTPKDGESREGRLQQAGWSIRTSGSDSGALSKPFRFQGKETESFVDIATGGFNSIFQPALGQYTIKDSVLYHAPSKPGKYKVQASIGGVSGEVEIEVSTDAAPSFPPQSLTFGAEPLLEDPYRRLAEHYSPFVAQETWFQWTADALVRSDFDDDWDAGNNWDSLGKGSTQAYVYYAAIESQSHWFLIYNFFHARDYSDNCVVGTCHENDNEGVVLAVRKDGSEFGKLETMETLAHNNVYSYVNDRAIRKGAHNIEGSIALHDGSHPMVFLEAGGHGALGATDKKSLFDASAKKWKSNTGITYVYKGVAERPESGVARDVGYELLPIYHHWWARAKRDTAESLLSAFYRYEPFGGRPRMNLAEVAGAFAGKEYGEDKAKPFWGWHDNATRKDKILATGQWAADPAYAVSRDLTFPSGKGVSLDYVFNPYLNTPEVPFYPIVRNVLSGEVAPGAPFKGSAPLSVAAGSAGAPTLPRPVVEQPSSGPGRCEVEVRVDGTVFLTFNGTQPLFEVVNGAAPQVRSSSCTAAPPLNGEFVAERKSGRGKVRLVDPQSARMEISDPSGGAATYKVLLRWK